MAKLTGRYRDLPCTSCPPPHISICSRVISVPPKSGMFVIINEPTLPYHNHSKSIVYISALGRAYSVGYDKRIMP